jgi:hypothetical protein
MPFAHVYSMNLTLCNDLKDEVEEIAAELDRVIDEDAEYRVAVLEERGYQVNGLEHIFVYGKQHKVNGFTFTACIESLNSSTNKGIEAEYRYKPSFKISDLFRNGNFELNEFQRKEKEFEIREGVLAESGLYFAILDDQIVLAMHFGLDQTKKAYSEFEAGIKKAKQYLENIAKGTYANAK